MAFAIRRAETADAGAILALLRALAGYEKLLSTFDLDELAIARDFFGPRPVCEAALAWREDEPVGLMTWYWTYASFRGQRGLFVEDLFVQPDYRGQGTGMGLLRHAARVARDAGAARLEWRVLDWNAPSIAFYQRLGAKRFEGWDTYRLENDAMTALAQHMTITLILAAADNGVIGRHGAIPWRIADDMKRFKAITMGHRVVMGRKTWDSLPKKPLPGRENVVVTRDVRWHTDGVCVRHDIADALDGDAMVIGGAEIYRAALPLADRIELTEVHQAFDGDAVFTFDRSPWREIARERHVTLEGLEYSYVTLVRA